MFQIHFLRGMKRRKEWKECPWCRILCHFKKPRYTSFLSAFSLLPSCARPTDHFSGAAGALPKQEIRWSLPAQQLSSVKQLVSMPGNSPTFRPRQAAALQLFLEHHSSCSPQQDCLARFTLQQCCGLHLNQAYTSVPEMGFIKAPTFSSWIHTILLRHKMFQIQVTSEKVIYFLASHSNFITFQSLLDLVASCKEKKENISLLTL